LNNELINCKTLQKHVNNELINCKTLQKHGSIIKQHPFLTSGDSNTRFSYQSLKNLNRLILNEWSVVVPCFFSLSQSWPLNTK